MSNLKKVLSLVLVFAFALTMFAGAIKAPVLPEMDTLGGNAYAEEALTVLWQLSVIKGDAEGNVMGDKSLTRAELCKILYCLYTGDTALKAIEFYGYTCNAFTDVKDGDWYVPYVNWAYSSKVVEGYGNKLFGPDDAVTGEQAAKMLACALGYDAAIEGMAGPNWALAAQRLSAKIGLVKGVSVDYSYPKPLKRTDMFVMVYNALLSNLVEYISGSAYATDVTLADKAFNLLIIPEAILVSSRDAGGTPSALGAYWTNGAVQMGNGGWLNAYTIMSPYQVFENIAWYDYQIANAANYARFTYKVYDANAVTGYRVVLINVNLGDDNTLYKELGQKYLLLLRKNAAVNNANDLMLLYGKPVEVKTDANYKKSAADKCVRDAWPAMRVGLWDEHPGATAGCFVVFGSGNWTFALTDMSARTYTYWGNTYTEFVDSTKWVNGKAVLTAIAWRSMSTRNTALYKTIDNDGDGIVDHFFSLAYQLAKVHKVADDGKITIIGSVYKTGTAAAVSELTGDVLLNGEPKVGDYIYVAYNLAEGKWYVKVLDIVIAHVVSTPAGSETYTLSDGNTYTWAQYFKGDPTLASAVKYDNKADIEAVIGMNAHTVSKANYKFFIDQDEHSGHKYIVAVVVDEKETFFTENYAIVTDISDNHELMGYARVQLWTEANRPITRYLKSINGLDVFTAYNKNYTFTSKNGDLHTIGWDRVVDALSAVYDLDRGDLVYVNAIDEYYVALIVPGYAKGLQSFYTDYYLAVDKFDYRQYNYDIPGLAKKAYGGWNFNFNVSYTSGGDLLVFNYSVPADDIQLYYTGFTWQAAGYLSADYLWSLMWTDAAGTVANPLGRRLDFLWSGGKVNTGTYLGDALAAYTTATGKNFTTWFYETVPTTAVPTPGNQGEFGGYIPVDLVTTPSLAWADYQLFRASQGVVFAYGRLPGTNEYAWRAYLANNFKSVKFATGYYGDDDDWHSVPSSSASWDIEGRLPFDEIIFGYDNNYGASNNLYIKAAKVTTVPAYRYENVGSYDWDVLPSGWINQTRDGRYVFTFLNAVKTYGSMGVTFSTFGKNGANGPDYTTVPGYYISIPMQFNKWDFVRLLLDDDGLVREVTLITPADHMVSYSQFMSGYDQFIKYTVTNMYWRGDKIVLEGYGSYWGFTWEIDPNTVYFYNKTGQANISALAAYNLVGLGTSNAVFYLSTVTGIHSNVLTQDNILSAVLIVNP